MGPKTGAYCPGWEKSSAGRIRSEHRIASYGYKSSTGYHHFKPCAITCSVHRAMLRTFLGPPPSPQHEVNHKDGNRGNNSLVNLEYVTHSENVKHAFQNNSEYRQRISAFRSKPILARALGASIWHRCPSIIEAACKLGMN